MIFKTWQKLDGFNKFPISLWFIKFCHLLVIVLPIFFVIFHWFPSYFHGFYRVFVTFQWFSLGFFNFLLVFFIFHLFSLISSFFHLFSLFLFNFFIGFLNCQMYSLIFQWIFSIFQWICWFQARKVKKFSKNQRKSLTNCGKWQNHDLKMTEKWQKNDRDKWQDQKKRQKQMTKKWPCKRQNSYFHVPQCVAASAF